MANGDGTWERNTWPEKVRAGVARRERYMAEAKLAPMPVTRQILNWNWLQIQTRFNGRFCHLETHVLLRWPGKHRRMYDINTDQAVLAKRSLLVVFGRVPISSGGWHARGGFVLRDIKYPDFAQRVRQASHQNVNEP